MTYKTALIEIISLGSILFKKLESNMFIFHLHLYWTRNGFLRAFPLGLPHPKRLIVRHKSKIVKSRGLVSDSEPLAHEPTILKQSIRWV